MNGRIKYSLLLFAAALFFLRVAPAAETGPIVTVDVIHSTDRYAQGETYPILFRLNIKKGWFIHGTSPEEDFLIPTVLSIDDSKDLTISEVLFPKPYEKKFEYSTSPVEVYSDTVMVHGTVNIARESSPGSRTVKGTLSYQACSYSSCLQPEDLQLKLDFTLVPAGSNTTMINRQVFQSAEQDEEDSLTERFDSGLFLSLLWIFLQGLALNLTPCIYPLIPITVSYFGGRTGRTRGHIILSGLIYISGLAVTNSILGVTAALSGGMLGAALQYPAVLIFISLIMILLGFSFFGFWEFNLPSFFTRIASKNYRGLFGTFFMGLTLGIVAAPCIGPFVLGLLIYVGQKGDPFLGFIYFFVLSIGIGLPLCILAIFSGAINRLPVSGDWMLWVRKVLGWILIFMGYYFIRPLISSPVLEHAVIPVLAVAAGSHLGWIDKTGRDRRLYNLIKKSISCIIIAAGVFYFFTRLDFSDRVNWTAYDETFFESAVPESKPAIMDVYADWCLPCRAMDEDIFTDPEVVKLSENFLMVRLDITTKFPGQDGIRRKYSIEGAPTIIFFDKNGRELPGLRIESKVSRDEFLLSMKKAMRM